MDQAHGPSRSKNPQSVGTSFSYYRQEPGSPADGPSARGWNQARRLICVHLQGPDRPQSAWGCTMQFLLKETWPTPDATFNNQHVSQLTGRPQSNPLVSGGLRTGVTEVPSCSIGAGRVGKPLTLVKNPTRLRELHLILPASLCPEPPLAHRRHWGSVSGPSGWLCEWTHEEVS